MRKRYYIFFVSRDAEGQIRKIPIPVHYLYVFLVGAVIGMLTITGIAGSYTRMLAKVQQFNELRTEKEALKSRYSQLERVTREKEIQVASLGSLASEVSTLYGLKADASLVTSSAQEFDSQKYAASLDQLYALKSSALTGVTTIALTGPQQTNVTTADWLRLAAAPNLWPVQGRVSGSFGERIDPFNGEGAFHRGIDISTFYGDRVYAPADGMVVFADSVSGYGRMLTIDHGHGISTRFGHLAGFVVSSGQRVQRGDVIAYVGQTGRSTGPHLHYEVRIHNTP
ncbi:MAG: M23 family metallopeptidase, partial [Acidobacteriales bacterium]|nr:M23 family metallopeptidase [Terriglobales bacterium]